MNKLLLSIFLILVSLSYSHAQWPEKEWPQKTVTAAGFDSAKIDQFLGYTFDPSATYKTDSVVIIKDGHIVLEKYANGFKRGQPHLLWSASKSFINTLYGIAEQKNILSRNDLASLYYPLLDKPETEDLTINNLLQMSSGFDWNEGYEKNILESNVVRMLYFETLKDTAAYVAKQKVKYPPGQRFYYSSGDSNLLMGILRNKLGNEKYHEFPWQELFKPLGITTATWERDVAGNFIGSSYLYLSPTDFARLGLLYLEDGIWQGQRLLPKDWVKYSTTAAPSFAKTKLEGAENRENYGSQWWLNASNAEKGEERPYPAAPENIYMALGHFGQSLTVFPDQKLIVVRTASDVKGKIDFSQFLKLFFESIEK